MAPINLHACEATTQETVGRGSSIDLHVCGASVCVEEPPSVCAHVSRREPHDVRQPAQYPRHKRTEKPTASHHPIWRLWGHGMCRGPTELGCWRPLLYGTGAVQYGIVRY